MNSWQEEHRKTIYSVLEYVNRRSDKFILKDGTALLACYGLDRFSEDIDFDGKSKDIGKLVDSFCGENGYTYRVAKDTDTVKRYMINYGNDRKPLKIETSFRRRDIDPDEVTKINGISVYKINPLCGMKANAYASRDKIRDMYDLTFISNRYWDELSSATRSVVRNVIEYKGVEQFDYIIKDQSDELIDNNKLADDFLKMYDKLGLLYTDEEKEIISRNGQEPGLDSRKSAQMEQLRRRQEQER